MANALIDLLTPPNVVPKQRVVDNFDGDSLNERWEYNNINGTNSGAMDNSIDGGYKITTGTTTNNRADINFAEKRQYDPASFVLIQSIKLGETSSRYCFAGLKNDASTTGNWVMFDQDTNDSFVQISTRNGTTNAVNTTISQNTNTQICTLKGNASFASLHINGSLEAISTSNLPTDKMQPFFLVATRTTAAKTGSIHYLEAYNT